ncbi:hypothetical protein JW960_18915 [candidate division KSB1 bacterium]|nr:hypothetical protein [candidate division KSB1 bacterium]
MKLNVMFTIAAILLILVGLGPLLSFVFPGIQATYGISDISTSFVYLILSVAQIVFGIVAWSVRKAPASKTRDSLALGYASLFALWAILNVIGSFGQFKAIPGHGNALWPWFVIFTLVAAGFFMADRTSNSKSRK